MNDTPRISFGMIVLNGEPFLRYNLRALYPFAHEIIVVEGAAPAAASIATADGHSLDKTLDTLADFKAREDPEGKLQVVTRDGFWREKDEMSQAYAERATGDYLWQVDVDEFYRPADMRAVIDLLRDQPDIDAVSFETITFWGAPDVIVDSWYLRRGAAEYHRLFKWSAGHRYTTHRPPTVVDAKGRDLRSGRWIRGSELAGRGIRMQHYSLLLPKQVLEKCEYYSRAEWARRQDALDWARRNWLSLERPFHCHNVARFPGCLYRFTGEQPPQVDAMWRDITTAGGGVEIRRRDDIDRLLRSRRYQLARALVMRANKAALWQRQTRRRLWMALARITPASVKRVIKRR